MEKSAYWRYFIGMIGVSFLLMFIPVVGIIIGSIVLLLTSYMGVLTYLYNYDPQYLKYFGKSAYCAPDCI